MTPAQRKAYAQQIADLFKRAGATPRSRGEAEYYLRKGQAGVDLLQRNLVRSGHAIAAPMTSEQEWAKRFLGVVPDQPDVPSFEQSGLYNEEDAAKLFGSIYDPYFTKQRTGEEQGKTWAQEDVTRALGRLNTGLDQELKYGQEDFATSDAERQRQLAESLRGLSDTAATGGQLGSGVYQREQGLTQDASARQKAALDRALGRSQAGVATRREQGSFDIQNPYAREYENQYGGYQQRLEGLRNKQAVTRSGFLSDEEQRARQRYADRFKTYPGVTNRV
jgi:hypothetical protein